MIQKQPSLKDRLHAKCKAMGRSPNTATAYWGWFEKYLRFHRRPNGEWVNPAQMGREEIEEFLTHLASNLNVSPSTQNQAFNGILFVYKNVLGIEVKDVNALRAYQPKYLSAVLSVNEVARFLDKLEGRNKLIAYLCYGAGMRIGEVFELRIKDIDFENLHIHIRQAKGHKDRIVPLPEAAVPLLRSQIEHTAKLHAMDVRDGKARVPLPYGLERKYPGESSKLYWYFLFSSDQRSEEPGTGRVGRYHLQTTTFTRYVGQAAQDAKIPKHVKSHTLRHSFATHLMNNRTPLKSIMELMGHNSLETTQIYMHVEQNSPAGTRSPLDSLPRVATNGRPA